MNTPDTFPFALPPHLGAKADPGLIARDEGHLRAVAETIHRQRSEATERLAARRRQPRGSGEYALERDADIRRLSSRGRITDYWDEVFTTEGLEHHAALDDQSAFIASLGDRRTGRMQDVLATIQADQDAIVRAGSRGALVVDGGPTTRARPSGRRWSPSRRPGTARWRV